MLSMQAPSTISRVAYRLFALLKWQLEDLELVTALTVQDLHAGVICCSAARISCLLHMHAQLQSANEQGQEWRF